MTALAHDTRETQESWWVLDSDLPAILGVPKKQVMEAVEMYDRDPLSGFPKREKLWGNRRYLPAVRAFFDRMYGLKIGRRNDG